MKLEVKISGPKVHDVGYRLFLLGQALGLGIKRFNAYNAREEGAQVVLAAVEGSFEQIAAFRDFADRTRPEGAKVSQISFSDFEGAVMGIMSYMHLFQAQQLSKGIVALQNIDGNEDLTLGKQDEMIAKLDEIKKEVVSEVKESREAIASEIKESFDDYRGALDERF